jgi:hypothetical protein
MTVAAFVRATIDDAVSSTQHRHGGPPLLNR